MEEKLDYIKDLNVDAIILSSFYDSPPGGDVGYDVTNHTAVNSLFGTIEDFDSLLAAAHKKGESLVMFFSKRKINKIHKD